MSKGRKKLVFGVVTVLVVGLLGVYYTSSQLPGGMHFNKPHEKKTAEGGEKQNHSVAMNDDKQQRVESEENNVDVQLSHHGRTTTAEPVNLDPMQQAASAIRTSYIPPSYRFSTELYFHPPSSNRPLNLPQLLHNPSDACSGEKGNETFLVVLVLSSYLDNGATERQAIRSTYGSVARGQRWPTKSIAAPVSLVFVLGRPPPGVQQLIVQQEVKKHGDLVVADFVDSYQNLTLKVLVGLDWARHHCPQASFILKTDDDTFVNLPLLTTFLLQRGRNNSLYGHPYFASEVARKGRWAVPQSAFPFPVYPVYMSGTGYVVSKDAAEKIVEASKNVPLIPIEDAYVTGILAQIGQIRRMFCSGFTHHTEGKPVLCDFMLDKRLVGNGMPAVEKTSMWALLRINDRRLC
ncbi:beta-1,3-galactosyltransferase 1-like [Littorina saxatilis]|uniref:beta-1,3-galactosyltransferase 1-like n=1 Tax=Littorina saxatilis TaxID=31220 RepID=UPI0038B5F8FF